MYHGPIVDCDVHCARRTPDEILPYVPQAWREHVQMPGGGATIPLAAAPLTTEPPDGRNVKLDSYPADGGYPGSDHRLMCEQLLDPFGIRLAVLDQTPMSIGLTNHELAAAMCSAENDWLTDVWLDGKGDDRLCGTVVVPIHYPDRGAAEIARVAGDERFVAAHIAFNPFSKPMGHAVHDPIFAAAAEAGLPLYFHASGTEAWSGSAPFQSGGSSFTYRFDMFQMAYQPIATHLASMIAGGVFEKFPTLDVVVAETGLGWLQWYVASLDSNYELMRRESTWVKRRPSEYLREHVVFTTQPCEGINHDRDAFVADLATIEGVEDMLAFSSDYPHWDGDVPTYIGSILPDAWHEKVFHGNARRILRMPASIELELEAAAPPVA